MSSRGNEEKALGEVRILSKLKHENIVGYNTVWKDRLTTAMLKRIKRSSSDVANQLSHSTGATSTDDRSDSGAEIASYSDTDYSKSLDGTENETGVSCSSSQDQRSRTSGSSVGCLSDEASVSGEEDRQINTTSVLVLS